jgi:hypothetical protein
MSITLKVIKVYGEKTEKVEDYLGETKENYIYPKNTKRVIRRLCIFPPKIKEVVQKCTIETALDGVVDIIHYNKWHDIKIKKQKNETE